MRFALVPAVCPVNLCANVGSRGATHRSACPVLCHSESGPLGLSAQMWGHMVCQWSDCRPRLSHTPPVSVPPRQRESSPPRLPISAPPTSLDQCLLFFPWFWTSLSFDFRSVLVGRGGAVCLPTPPSWFFIEFHFFAHSCPDLPTPSVEEAIFAPFYAPASFVKYQLIV